MAPAAEAVPSEEELPVVEVFRTRGDMGDVVVKWGEGGAQQTTSGLADSYPDSFHVTDSTGDEPFVKTFGTLLHCHGGILTISETRYRMQVKQRQQAGYESHTSLTAEFKQLHVSPFYRSTSRMPDLFAPTKKTKSRDMLLDRLKLLETRNSRFAPFLAIVQSSGYGKTRTILEVAKVRQVVYLLCRDIRGGLQAPAVMTQFVNDITAETSTESRERRATKFFQCVMQCALPYQTADDLFRAQFNSEHATFGRFYDTLATTVEAAKTPPTSPVKDQTATEASPSPLVVVFDEALCLTENEGFNCDSPYRCIRRILKYFGLIGVFLDTSGKLHHFVPEGASSDRETGIGQFPPPIFEIDTFDVFRNEVDMTNTFFLGRPLWKMQWEHRLDCDYERLIQFACHKLLPKHDDADGLCALFLCRFGLQARKSLAEKLVADHMATLVSVSVDRETVVTNYKSEPILAEAAAFLTSYGTVSPATVLKEVCNNLDKTLLACDKGDRGEVAAAAWLGYSLDNVRKAAAYNAKTSNLSREAVLQEFLQEVFPDMLDQEAVDSLSGWKVNFTHFCRLGFTPDSSILARCWNQRAALYMLEGEEGIDLLVALKKETDTETFATLRVQVKNYKNKITRHSVADLLEKLDVRRCAPRTLVKDEPFSVGLLVQVGEGDMENFSNLSDLGRRTRSNSLGKVAQQLRLACRVSGQYARSIHSLAGESFDNKNFISSSDAFREGEWFKPMTSDEETSEQEIG